MSALASAGCATAPPPSREEVLRKILPSAVQVVVEQHEGRRITSGHTFSGIAGEAERALLIASRNDSIDLALLRAESDQCNTVSPASAPVLGEPIWVIGFPAGRHIMLSSGVVSQVMLDGAGDPAAAARLIVDAPVSYGVSGGGVFEARTGRLIGLVEGFSTIRRFLREFEQVDLLPP